MTARNLKQVFEKIAQLTHFLDKDLEEVELTEINQRDWTGDSPLHVAARSCEAEEIQILIANGADVNARGEQGMTPLHYAVLRGDLAIATTLLEGGAEPRIRDDEGRTALDWARTSNRLDAVALVERLTSSK